MVLDNTMWNDMVEAKGLTTETAAWVRGQYGCARKHWCRPYHHRRVKFFTSVVLTGEPIPLG